MSKPIQVWFEEAIENGDLVRRLVFEDIEGPDGPRAESWWRIPGSAHAAELPVLDSLVCSHALWAATLGQDLVVHGPMSAGGLYNLGQLLELRKAMAPARYKRPIAVVPDRVITGGRPPDTANRVMVAYSGGLDSTFTVTRHARGLADEAAYPVAGLVMVLGFDIPLHRADRFEALRRRLNPLVESLGLPLHTVVTNSMLLGGRTWPQAAMPLFGSALVHFSGISPAGMVSSSATHGTPRFNAVSHGSFLDALCSNDFFRLITDGGGYGRADKAEALLPYPEALAAVKVCWQGPDPAVNCGACQKCIMTRLDFLAAGLPDPPCFDGPLTLDHIATLELHSMYGARDFFRFCWSELEARGVAGPEVTLLRQRLSRVPPDALAPAVQRWAGHVRRLVPTPIRQSIHRAWARLSS